MSEMLETYRDGIKATRCASCGTVILDGADDPLVSLRRQDVEWVKRLAMVEQERILKEAGGDSPLYVAYMELIQRLAQALGRPVREEA